MLGILVTAKPLVLTLFGDQWLGSVAPLQILCLGGIVQPMQTLNGSVLMAQGHSKQLLKAEMIVRVIGVITIIAASPFGMMAIAWSTVLYAVAGFLLKAHYSETLLGYSVVRQMRDMAPVASVSIAMALAVWLTSLFVHVRTAVELIIEVFLGALVYLALSILFRLEAFVEVKASAMDLFAKMTHVRGGAGA
jgi:O-antigen/teichoic acid export membrane protein